MAPFPAQLCDQPQQAGLQPGQDCATTGAQQRQHDGAVCGVERAASWLDRVYRLRIDAQLFAVAVWVEREARGQGGAAELG